MNLRKWNERKREYEPYKIPDDWNVKTYSDDMDMIINCAACGKKELFGNAYTSMTIHGVGGMGYAVCHDCYEMEYKERKKYMNMENDND